MLFNRRGLIIGAGAFVISWPAFGAANATALLLYRSGAFEDAANRAAGAGTADDLVLAARALLAVAVVDARRADALNLIVRAQGYGERALSLAPGSVEARLYIAAALGLRGRREGIGVALERGYAPRSRALIGEALARAPREAWAHALLGGWNLEIVRRGGTAGAMTFHAGRGAGVAAFERARLLAPNDPVVPVQFAVGLLGVGHAGDFERVRSLLEVSQRIEPRDAFEAFVQRQGAIIAHAAEHSAHDALAEADRCFP